MGGSGGGGRSQTVQTVPESQTPKVLPELQPFVARVGQLSQGIVDNPNLSLDRFAKDQTLQVPGLSNLENIAQGQIFNRGTFGIPTPESETAAKNSLGSFATGNMGDTPAVQAAVQGLNTQILPAVQNQMARQGLSQSGEMPRQMAQSFAQQLVPLYSQGMTNQLQAAQGLNTIGQQEYQRPIEALKEMTSMGETGRGIEQARAQADMDSYLRAREMALGFVNPFGSFAAFSGIPPQQTSTTTTKGGGFGFGK